MAACAVPHSTDPKSSLPDIDCDTPFDAHGVPLVPLVPQKRAPKRGSDPLAPGIVAARIQRIALLMATGEWTGYASAFALAAEWGLKVSSVQQYAVYAGAVMDTISSSDETLRAMMASTLQTIVARSMQKDKFREATEAIKALAGLTGLDKTHAAAHSATMVAVGIDDLIGAKVREAVAANAASDEDGGGKGR